MGQWVFEELRGAAVRRAPQEAELFKTEQAQEGEYAGTDALVREVIQNSLDARHGAGPVRVRIAIHEAEEAPSPDRLAHYFGRLREPLAAKRIEFTPASAPQLPCRFLVCEDFGTRGLEGNVYLFQDPVTNGKAREDSYWFWRNIGRSGKTGIDLGRWGLGKTVYRAASRVACMLGMTTRHSDGQRFLMGQAVLQIHRHGGKEYQPEGYWCGQQDGAGLPLPIEDVTELARFCQEWKLTRTNEPGLSVVSPYLHDELRPDRILQAVAVHFFARILRGELVVEVAGWEQDPQVLDKACISQVCEKIVWDGPKRTKRHMAPPLDFARQCLAAPPSVSSELLGEKRLPETSEAFVGDELNTLRQRFSAGQLVGLQMRLWLPLLSGGGQEGHADVYLQRSGVPVRHDSYYVREGMTITKINSRAGQRGVQALVIVDSGPLAELLGDTEGPAHEDWLTSAERPSETWKTWKGRVTYVRKIVDSLVELLTPPATQPDFDLLADFFSIQRTQGQQPQPKRGKEKEEDTGMEPVTSKPKWFQITERAGGFTVSRNASTPLPTDPALKLAMAYDLPRGDPLRNWSPLDFKISNESSGLPPKGRGVKVKRIQDNVLRLAIEEEDFHFSLDGFDRHRDLFVRVDDVSNDQPDEDQQQ